MADWSTKESRENHRKKGGYFAGPDDTFPLTDASDVSDAWGLAGHAANPDQVRRNIIRWAKSNGHTDALPDTATEWAKEHDVELANQPELVRSVPTSLSIPMDIIRVDAERREVVARATSTSKDSYKTAFDYKGSKEAFAKWRGNIREMHDPHKAVGRAFDVIPRDDEEAIDLVIRISKGAEDTWQKVLDGTLAGASIGARNAEYEERIVDGEKIPVYTRYDLVEVSLVDNPSNPDCNIAVIRSNGDQLETTDVVDQEEVAEVTDTEQVDESRAGKTISAATATKMHQTAIHAIQAAKAAHDMCGCPTCKSVSMVMDPDQDGDIDIIPELDTDGDGGGKVNGLSSVMSSIQPELVRMVGETVGESFSATVRRLNTIAARLAQVDNADLTRRLVAVEDLKGEVQEVRSVLAEVRELTTRIANRPATGGPVVSTGGIQRTAPTVNVAELAADIVTTMIQSGIITGREQQIKANMLVQQLAQGATS